MEGKLGQADGTQGGRVVSLRERAPLAAVGRSGVLNSADEGGRCRNKTARKAEGLEINHGGIMAKSRKGQSCIEASRHQLLLSLSCSCWVMEAENEMDALLLAEPPGLAGHPPPVARRDLSKPPHGSDSSDAFTEDPDCCIQRSL